MIPTPKVAGAKSTEAIKPVPRATRATVTDKSPFVADIPKLVVPSPAKRAAVDLPAEKASSSKVARKSSSLVVRRDTSRSSASSHRIPDTPSVSSVPSPLAASPLISNDTRNEVILSRLSSLEDSIRMDMRRSEASFKDHLRRLEEVRKLIAEGRD